MPQKPQLQSHIIVGAFSVAMSQAGLELCARIGDETGQHGEILGGLIVIAVGAAVAAGVL
jgi:putative Mn2+ efflux pump MntP